MSRRRKGIKAPSLTDDEIRAMLKRRYHYIEPNEPDTITVDEATWRALHQGRPREEWRTEAYRRVHQHREHGMSGEDACKLVFPDYMHHNRTYEAFVAGYWAYKRETAWEKFLTAILASDFDTAVEKYKLLSEHAKRKLKLP